MHNNDQSNQPNWNIFKTILEYLFPPEEHKLFGKLFVSGTGALEFSFKHLPTDVFVAFDNDCYPTPCSPCDPGQDDGLSWRIIKHKHHYILVIEWEVSSMRTIYWKVCP